MTPNYLEKVKNVQRATLEQLEHLLKVSRVYASPSSEFWTENVELIEREIAWRRQKDGPFR